MLFQRYCILAVDFMDRVQLGRTAEVSRFSATKIPFKPRVLPTVWAEYDPYRKGRKSCMSRWKCW